MIDIAMQAMQHVRHLCVDVGHRPIGSPEDHQAEDYIEHVFRDSGLEISRQVYTCPTWNHHETILESNNHRLTAIANWFSLPCDVTGVVVAVRTIDALKRADLAGRIVLLYGSLTKYEIAPRASTVYYPPDYRKINQLLDEKRPAAVITECSIPDALQHVIKDPDMPIPSVTVPPEIGRILRQHKGESVHLRISALRSNGHTSNILGTRLGSRPERIVICAHYDTAWGAPGAIDNASGVGVMLTVAQILSKIKLLVGLEFVAFSAEEATGLGADEYIKPYGLKHFPFRPGREVWTHSEVWQPILAVINADGVGLEKAANTMTLMAASDEFRGLLDEIKRNKYPDIVWVPPWPASNHYIFYPHGVPSIALCFARDVVPNVIHQPTDTIDWINPNRLAEVVKLVTDVVIALQDKESTWCRGTT